MVRTYCRFWIRMKDSTIYAGVGSPSLNRSGIMFGGYEYRCAGVSRVLVYTRKCTSLGYAPLGLGLIGHSAKL